eukprot:jgi/Mesvir1/25427/Mv01708-RA.1
MATFNPREPSGNLVPHTPESVSVDAKEFLWENFLLDPNPDDTCHGDFHKGEHDIPSKEAMATAVEAMDPTVDVGSDSINTTIWYEDDGAVFEGMAPEQLSQALLQYRGEGGHEPSARAQDFLLGQSAPVPDVAAAGYDFSSHASGAAGEVPPGGVLAMQGTSSEALFPPPGEPLPPPPAQEAAAAATPTPPPPSLPAPGTAPTAIPTTAAAPTASAAPPHAATKPPPHPPIGKPGAAADTVPAGSVAPAVVARPSQGERPAPSPPSPLAVGAVGTTGLPGVPTSASAASQSASIPVTLGAVMLPPAKPGVSPTVSASETPAVASVTSTGIKGAPVPARPPTAMVPKPAGAHAATAGAPAAPGVSPSASAPSVGARTTGAVPAGSAAGATTQGVAAASAAGDKHPALAASFEYHEAGLWTPQDDLLLKDAMEASAATQALARGAMRFSRRFTAQELRARWHALLYHPGVASAALSAIDSLLQSGEVAQQPNNPWAQARPSPWGSGDEHSEDGDDELMEDGMAEEGADAGGSLGTVPLAKRPHTHHHPLSTRGGRKLQRLFQAMRKKRKEGAGVAVAQDSAHAATTSMGGPISAATGVLPPASRGLPTKDAIGVAVSSGQGGPGTVVAAAAATPQAINPRGTASPAAAAVATTPSSAAGGSPAVRTGPTGTVTAGSAPAGAAAPLVAAGSTGAGQELPAGIAGATGKDILGARAVAVAAAAPGSVAASSTRAAAPTAATPATAAAPVSAQGTAPPATLAAVVSDTQASPVAPVPTAGGAAVAPTPSPLVPSAVGALPAAAGGVPSGTPSATNSAPPAGRAPTTSSVSSASPAAAVPSSAPPIASASSSPAVAGGVGVFPAPTVMPVTVAAGGVTAACAGSQGASPSVASPVAAGQTPAPASAQPSPQPAAQQGGTGKGPAMVAKAAPPMVSVDQKSGAEEASPGGAKEVGDAVVAAMDSGEESDAPAFSDVEATILDMDLSPGPVGEDGAGARADIPPIMRRHVRSACRLEQSMTSALTRHMSKRGALACLGGRKFRYLLRKTEVTLGRETARNQVDINLADAEEGRANKVSRVQACIKLRRDGCFYVRNLGRRAMFINNRAIASDQRWKLENNCLLEVGGMRFFFIVNIPLVKEATAWLNNYATEAMPPPTSPTPLPLSLPAPEPAAPANEPSVMVEEIVVDIDMVPAMP